jgi:hypothetical protein
VVVLVLVLVHVNVNVPEKKGEIPTYPQKRYPLGYVHVQVHVHVRTTIGAIGY